MDVPNSMPLVSVVMPSYNAENYIKEAIEAVLSQTVSDLELLVIDDCSTDGTIEIVNAFAAQDSRVKLIVNEKNLGAGRCSYAIVDKHGAKLCNDFIVPEETDFEKSLVRSVITCSTVLVNGELGRKMCFPTNVYHEDIALWFQLLRDGVKACGVTEVLASYRQHEGSRSSSKLASAYRRWPIYRQHLGLSVMESAKYMAKYAYYGFKKYKTI